jgi:hypothetical protein
MGEVEKRVEYSGDLWIAQIDIRAVQAGRQGDVICLARYLID